MTKQTSVSDWNALNTQQRFIRKRRALLHTAGLYKRSIQFIEKYSTHPSAKKSMHQPLHKMAKYKC